MRWRLRSACSPSGAVTPGADEVPHDSIGAQIPPPRNRCEKARPARVPAPEPGHHRQAHPRTGTAGPTAEESLPIFSRPANIGADARARGESPGAGWARAVSASYGAATSLILVSQFASAVRVSPQRKLVFRYWERVQLWPMYSEAIQTLLPSGTAAP